MINYLHIYRDVIKEFDVVIFTVRWSPGPLNYGYRIGLAFKTKDDIVACLLKYEFVKSDNCMLIEDMDGEHTILWSNLQSI
jgi:hypothetical protein